MVVPYCMMASTSGSFSCFSFYPSILKVGLFFGDEKRKAMVSRGKILQYHHNNRRSSKRESVLAGWHTDRCARSRVQIGPLPHSRDVPTRPAGLRQSPP